MSALLAVENLSVEFDTDAGVVHALDGVSYDVNPGTTLAMVGESGSGKSVSALAAVGLMGGERARVSGRIVFEGRDLLSLSDDELRRIRGDDIAIVFPPSESALDPFSTVGHQLNEAVLAHRSVSVAAARDRAIGVLELVGLHDAHRLVSAHPHELSPGIRQRIQIAMALANQPKLLIADEPTTGLDVTVQAQILAVLDDLRQRLEIALIVITPDLGVAAELADEIAVMYAGRIVERASAERILANPQHPYTWGLLQSTPWLVAPQVGDPVPIPGPPPSLIDRPSGCPFHPRCAYVRPEHRRTVPTLQPVLDAPGHEVACLLGVEVRTQLWEGIEAGRPPEELRRLAVEEPAREPIAAAEHTDGSP